MPDASEGIPLPPHAYVPGENKRHAEGWFDTIKQSVTPETPAGQLHLTQAWMAGRLFFEAGYFWECHEVLEAIWMQAPEGTPERDMVQALIQLANARLKIRMQRPNAALRLCTMVETHLGRCAGDRAILGLMVGDMHDWVEQTRKAAEHTEYDL